MVSRTVTTTTTNENNLELLLKVQLENMFVWLSPDLQTPQSKKGDSVIGGVVVEVSIYGHIMLYKK